MLEIGQQHFLCKVVCVEQEQRFTIVAPTNALSILLIIKHSEQYVLEESDIMGLSRYAGMRTSLDEIWEDRSKTMKTWNMQKTD